MNTISCFSLRMSISIVLVVCDVLQWLGIETSISQVLQVIGFPGDRIQVILLDRHSYTLIVRLLLMDRNCTSSSLQVILCGYPFLNHDDGWSLVFGLTVYNFLTHELSDLPCITGKQGYIDAVCGLAFICWNRNTQRFRGSAWINLFRSLFDTEACPFCVRIVLLKQQVCVWPIFWSFLIKTHWNVPDIKWSRLDVMICTSFQIHPAGNSVNSVSLSISVNYDWVYNGVLWKIYLEA